MKIDNRVAMEGNHFYKKKILLIKNFVQDLKERIVTTTLWSVTLHQEYINVVYIYSWLYVYEIRTLKQNNVKKLKTFEMRLWRKIGKISGLGHTTNEDVLN